MDSRGVSSGVFSSAINRGSVLDRAGSVEY